MAGFRIPFFRPSIEDSDIQAVTDVLRSGWLTSGPQLSALEGELAAYCGATHVNALNSCTAALHLALAAWDIGPGDEVITTPYTFSATANVVVHLGASPVFVDVREQDANIDPRLIEAAITPRTRAIIPVHIAGEPCDMDVIMAIAERHRLKVLEDAAHAIGTLYHGVPIGGIGDATAFSFYANKTITTGEGGALATNDQDLSDRVRVLTLHGMSRDAWKRYDVGGSWRYDIVEFGYKDNLTDIAASLGRTQLSRIESFIEQRTVIAQRYIANLRDEEHLQLPSFSEENRHAWHLFMVRVKESAPLAREDVVRKLAEAGVQTSVHFIPLHYFTAYRNLGRWKEGDFPVAERFFSGEISLPMFPGMTTEEVDEVSDSLRTILHP